MTAMTRQEKITAFTMRIDGASYQEIGDYLGLSRQFVMKSMKRTLDERNIKTRCVYPAISQWMNRHRVNGAELSRKLCYVQGTVYQYLGGYVEPSRFFREAMSKLTGISEEILFRRLSDE